MPFFHDGTFHLFYLLDENHHQGHGGLGWHQWAHATSSDLRHWQHHPLALPITQPWEASICTGSVFWHDGLYYAFYATRKPDWTQHLCVATSRDGICFEKSPANPLLSPPPGYSSFDFRDPFVFQDPLGGFQMLVTARLDPFPLFDRGGCLLRLSSADLTNWHVEEPFLIPGGEAGYRSVPECSDYFYWNGWYYLLYSLGLQTYYRMSRQPLGPWLKPAVDLLDSPLNHVMKTCSIWDNRRIGVGFIGTREGGSDAGRVQWAGSIVFRELVQAEDGALSTRLVPEMMPQGQQRLFPHFEALTAGARLDGQTLTLEAPQSQEVAALSPVPQDFIFSARVLPGQGGVRFGLGLRGSGNYERKIALVFEPALAHVALADQRIEGVCDLDQPFDLEVYCQSDIVEVCVDHRRCLINRLPDLRGERLFFFCEHGEATFQSIRLDSVG